MLELVPISLKEANAYVERYHRHHKPVVGHGLYKVQVGAYTKKENAEATVKRLKAAGIVCFITHA